MDPRYSTYAQNQNAYGQNQNAYGPNQNAYGYQGNNAASMQNPYAPNAMMNAP
jgi:hypothetical protein